MTPHPHELTWARRITAMDGWDIDSKAGYKSAARTARWVLDREARPYPLSATEDEAREWCRRIQGTLRGEEP